MSFTGAIAPNFHEGTRSEYLAQYVFSAFGTSIPVPHPEDSGIDLYCTLGKRIGQRLHIQNYYLVQVKSHKKDICYNNEKSVKWLLSHNYPLLICFINKQSARIEIFQTLTVTTCYAKLGIKSISIIPEAPSDGEIFKEITQEENLRIYLGHPILDFNISKMQEEKFVNKAMAVLKSWVELDQESINQKAIGFTFFRVPETYKTNHPIETPKKFVGNFKDMIGNVKVEPNFYDVLFKMLSQIVHQVAAEKDIEKFGIISDFAGRFISQMTLKNSWGIWLLAAAVNTGSVHLKLPQRISISTSDGRKETPMLNIVSDKSNK